jgi:hypothetical protein
VVFTRKSAIRHAQHAFSIVPNSANTTPEGKEHAREQLKALGDKSFDYESKIPEEQHKDPTHVAAGLKAYV